MVVVVVIVVSVASRGHPHRFDRGRPAETIHRPPQVLLRLSHGVVDGPMDLRHRRAALNRLVDGLHPRHTSQLVVRQKTPHFTTTPYQIETKTHL